MKREAIIGWLRARAFHAAPYEACGFILDDGEIVEVRNVADDPSVGFLMDAQDLSEKLTTDQLLRIIAIWHTHPKSTTYPSQRDIEAINDGAVSDDWLYLIATKDGVTQWNSAQFMPQGADFWSQFIA